MVVAEPTGYEEGDSQWTVQTEANEAAQYHALCPEFDVPRHILLQLPRCAVSTVMTLIRTVSAGECGLC